MALPLRIQPGRHDLITIDDTTPQQTTPTETTEPTEPPTPTTWHDEWWARITGLLSMGAYMFVWGLIFAIVVAGAFMLVGALLMWALPLLLMILYPILCLGEWIINLFRRDRDPA